MVGQAKKRKSLSTSGVWDVQEESKPKQQQQHPSKKQKLEVTPKPNECPQGKKMQWKKKFGEIPQGNKKQKFDEIAKPKESPQQGMNKEKLEATPNAEKNPQTLSRNQRKKLMKVNVTSIPENNQVTPKAEKSRFSSTTQGDQENDNDQSPNVLKNQGQQHRNQDQQSKCNVIDVLDGSKVPSNGTSNPYESPQQGMKKEKLEATPNAEEKPKKLTKKQRKIINDLLMNCIVNSIPENNQVTPKEEKPKKLKQRHEKILRQILMNFNITSIPENIQVTPKAEKSRFSTTTQGDQENDNDEKEWKNSDTLILVARIEEACAENLSGTYFDVMKNVDWSKISFGGHSVKKCKKVWCDLFFNAGFNRVLVEDVRAMLLEKELVSVAPPKSQGDKPQKESKEDDDDGDGDVEEVEDEEQGSSDNTSSGDDEVEGEDNSSSEVEEEEDEDSDDE